MKGCIMSTKINGYVRFAIAAADIKSAAATLAADKGLPKDEWTAAHAAAVKLLSVHYKEEARDADARGKLEWSSGKTFEGGSAAQRALSRVCGLITGDTQKKMREAEKARRAFSKLDKGEKATAQVEKAFASLEKMAGREDLSNEAKRAIVRHAKHILLLLNAK
jgi:hypothetical protein